ncbi:hypothetical protein B0H21DRAFT_767544 [Amylocystis lapponica]|nr:hypothetical protein B0H21DRAFT_767544 [Amylocystis lapponica]
MHKDAKLYGRVPCGDDYVDANVSKLYSSEDVEIWKGVRDTTSRIRHKLAMTAFCVPEVRWTTYSVNVQSTSGTTTVSTPSSGTHAPLRVLSRLLMETFGWPIKFFKDSSELLRVILALRGASKLKLSSGHILICPEDDAGEKTQGRIIDLAMGSQPRNLSILFR